MESPNLELEKEMNLLNEKLRNIPLEEEQTILLRRFNNREVML